MATHRGKQGQARQEQKRNTHRHSGRLFSAIMLIRSTSQDRGRGLLSAMRMRICKSGTSQDRGSGLLSAMGMRMRICNVALPITRNGSKNMIDCIMRTVPSNGIYTYLYIARHKKHIDAYSTTEIIYTCCELFSAVEDVYMYTILIFLMTVF